MQVTFSHQLRCIHVIHNYVCTRAHNVSFYQQEMILISTQVCAGIKVLENWGRNSLNRVGK